MSHQADPADTRPVILVVEAEPLLAAAASDTLDDAGFATVHARSVDQAIAILERRADIRIVFTDIDMPHGLDGMRLAACVRHRWPPIEIILTSTGARPPVSDLPARSIFLHKPYSSQKLVDSARSMAH